MADADAEAPPGIAEWCELSDALVRGLVHALNNRLTAMSASVELAEMGDDEFSAARVLPGELSRLQQVSALLRLLATEPGPAEALEVAPLAEEAAALHQHHPRLGGARIPVAVEGARMPVRAPRWALLRLLLLLMEGERRAAEAEGRDRAQLRIAGDERVVELHAGSAVTPYARTMALICGAAPEDDMADGVVRLPSLLELRRRERERRTG